MKDFERQVNKAVMNVLFYVSNVIVTVCCTRGVI